MVTIQNGLTGLIVVHLVAEACKYDQETAPAPLHSTMGTIAINWEQLIRKKNATQILVVSF